MALEHSPPLRQTYELQRNLRPLTKTHQKETKIHPPLAVPLFQLGLDDRRHPTALDDAADHEQQRPEQDRPSQSQARQDDRLARRRDGVRGQEHDNEALRVDAPESLPRQQRDGGHGIARPVRLRDAEKTGTDESSEHRIGSNDKLDRSTHCKHSPADSERTCT